MAGRDGELRLDDARAGSPFVSGFHVVPPSVDLKMPPPVPPHAAFSHGPWRCSHIVA